MSEIKKKNKIKNGNEKEEAGNSKASTNDSNNSNIDAAIMHSDARAKKIARDPKFAAIKKKNKVVVNGDDEVDERFKDVMEEDDDAIISKIDKFGRKNKPVIKKQGKDKSKGIDGKDYERLNYLNKLARGEISDASSSEEDDDDDEDNESDTDKDSKDQETGKEEEEESIEDEEEKRLKELDKPELTHATSNRLSVMNCDWAHLRAIDLLAVFQSFVPPSGSINRACVYLSRFGKERLEKEKLHGPQVNMNDDEHLDLEKLRKYEKSKLKYYFGVLECDSAETVNAIYEACDGMEFDRSSVVFDLRIIPDDVVIDTPLRDHADEVPVTYRPPDFYNKALQHTKVELLWDGDDDFQREQVLKSWGDKGGRKNVNDAENEALLNAFIASSSEEEEEEEDDDDDDSDEEGKEKSAAVAASKPLGSTKPKAKSVPLDKIEKARQVRSKYAALLGLSSSENVGASKKEDGPKSKKEESSEDDDEEESDNEANIKSIKKDDKQTQNKKKTPAVVYERKPENRIQVDKAAKRERASGVKDDEDGIGNDKNFEIDTKDDRFADVFQDPSFQIDRTDPNFKESSTLKKIVEERIKRKDSNKRANENNLDEVSKLVASIKNKSSSNGNERKKQKN